MSLPDNEDIADPLERIALLLEEQNADRYRVRAYRRVVRGRERECRDHYGRGVGTDARGAP